MAKDCDELSFLHIEIHLVDSAGCADHVAFLVTLLIFKYQFLRLNHVHKDASYLLLHFIIVRYWILFCKVHFIADPSQNTANIRTEALFPP